jgi:hypothetical protein
MNSIMVRYNLKEVRVVIGTEVEVEVNLTVRCISEITAVSVLSNYLFSKITVQYFIHPNILSKVVLWWVFLCPLIALGVYASKGKEGLIPFLKWNGQTTMLLVHGMNFFLASFEHVLINPRRLNYSDLWMGYVSLAVYIWIYIGYLDLMNNIHFYPPANPRLQLSIVFYVFVCLLYWKAFVQWDRVVGTMDDFVDANRVEMEI